jgi:hypothetical protein
MQLRTRYRVPIVARSPVSHGYPFRFVVVRYARCQGFAIPPRYTYRAIRSLLFVPLSINDGLQGQVIATRLFHLIGRNH